MGEDRHRMAQRLVDEDLERRVGEVIVAPDDVGYPHLGVIDHGGEVVGGSAIAAREHEVVHGARRKDGLAANPIVDDDVAPVCRYRQPPDVRLAGGKTRGNRSGVQPSARPIVAGNTFCNATSRPLGLESLGGAEAGIGAARGFHMLEGCSVVPGPLGLEVGTERPADLGAFVPVDPQPLEGAEDLAGILRRRAFTVGVVDAQDEHAAVAAGERPVVYGRARAADM